MTPNLNTTSSPKTLKTVSCSIVKVPMNSILLKIVKRTSPVACQKKLTSLMYLLWYYFKKRYCKLCSLFAQCTFGWPSYENIVSDFASHVNWTIWHHLLTLRYHSSRRNMQAFTEIGLHYSNIWETLHEGKPGKWMKKTKTLICYQTFFHFFIAENSVYIYNLNTMLVILMNVNVVRELQFHLFNSPKNATLMSPVSLSGNFSYTVHLHFTSFKRWILMKNIM